MWFGRKKERNYGKKSVIPCRVRARSFSFVLIRKKKNQKERIKAAFFRLLRCSLRLKGRNSLRSNSLPFLTPEKTPALDAGKTRPGNHSDCKPVRIKSKQGELSSFYDKYPWRIGFLRYKVHRNSTIYNKGAVEQVSKLQISPRYKCL